MLTPVVILNSSPATWGEVPLPIDAKFPREDYERLIDAQERADPLAVEEAAKALEARIRQEARTIRGMIVALVRNKYRGQQ